MNYWSGKFGLLYITLVVQNRGVTCILSILVIVVTDTGGIFFIEEYFLEISRRVN